MERVAAIVLAAGLSSRMGAFKPLLEIEGRTLLERAVSTFTSAGVEDVIVVAGHRFDDVAAGAAAAGAEVLTNPEYDRGMYSSLRVGVLGLGPAVTRFFLQPADVPLVRPETVGKLLRAAGRPAADGERLEVVYPAFGDATGHPPLIDATLCHEIHGSEPPGGLRGLLLGHAARSVVVEVDDPGVLLDADTPDDLERIRELAPREALPDVARCLQLLSSWGVPRERIAHSLVVAAVAASLTAALNARRQHLVPALVSAGTLLHDIARDRPHHADAGADLLEDLGYPRVAVVVRPHARLGARAADEPDEAQVVYLADKLVQGTRVVSLDARFTVRLERYAGDEAAQAGVLERREEARTVLRRVERILGAPVAEVLPAGA